MERTGKASVRASSALGSSGENILPPNLQDGCPSPENNPTASAHAFPELLLHSRAAFSKQRSLKPLRSCHCQECMGEDFVRGRYFPHELSRSPNASASVPLSIFHYVARGTVDLRD